MISTPNKKQILECFHTIKHIGEGTLFINSPDKRRSLFWLLTAITHVKDAELNDALNLMVWDMLGGGNPPSQKALELAALSCWERICESCGVPYEKI